MKDLQDLKLLDRILADCFPLKSNWKAATRRNIWRRNACDLPRAYAARIPLHDNRLNDSISLILLTNQNMVRMYFDSIRDLVVRPSGAEVIAPMVVAAPVAESSADSSDSDDDLILAEWRAKHC